MIEILVFMSIVAIVAVAWAIYTDDRMGRP